MNLLSKAFRTTCIPQMDRLDTPIPSEYVGREIEIIIVPLESGRKNKKKRILPPHINTSGWKFNREEANER